MRFIEFHLSGFAQHQETSLRFASASPSLIIGPNESGKSHLLTALIGTLFGMNDADWKVCLPWDGTPVMCGELRFETDDQQILVRRRFSENLVEVFANGNRIYQGRGRTIGRTLPEDEAYQRMLAGWVGFSEMEIFRDVVFVEQDQLIDDRLKKRTSEIKRLISGSHEASYETALTDLTADLDKLKRLPRKRNDREIEELEKIYADLLQRVAVAEQAETQAVDLLESELLARSRLGELGTQQSTLTELLDTYRRSHVLRSRLDQQTHAYTQSNAALKQAGGATTRRADLASLASQLRVPGDPDPSAVRAAQFEQSRAIADCRQLEEEISENEATLKRLQLDARAAKTGQTRTRPRYVFLLAAAVVALFSLLLAATVDPRALTGLPVAGMLLIATFLFPRTVHDDPKATDDQVKLSVAESRRAQLAQAMERARERLHAVSVRTGDWLTASNEPTLDTLIARLDRYRDTTIRFTETDGVDEVSVARLQRETDEALTQLAITKREYDQLQVDHPELLDLAPEEVIRHQRTIEQLGTRIATLNDTLRENDVQRRVLRQTTVDDAAALRVDVQAVEAEIARKRRLAAALELAIEVMDACVHDFQEHALDPVGGEAGRLLQRITAGRHTEVQIDQQTMEPTVTTLGRPVEVGSLSRGTRDQLYLAMRVALVDAISGGIRLPLIFDDPCVHFDSERLASTARILGELASERQIIILTKDESYCDWFDPVLRLHAAESVTLEGESGLSWL